MARTLIYKECATDSNGNRTREVYWDTGIRDTVYLTVANTSTCSNSYIPEGTLLDSWYEGTTKVEIRSKGSLGGRPERPPYTRTETQNAPGGEFNPCGLNITDLIIEETTPNTFRLIILTSSVSGELEYSLNNFTNVQQSNIFENLEEGDYTAYVRVKL